MIIYAVYKKSSPHEKNEDFSYKKYIRYFEDELDCCRYCMRNNYKYDSLYVIPKSQENPEEMVENFKNLRYLMEVKLR